MLSDDNGWRTDEPPVGVLIEYERQDGVIGKGRLVYAGRFGLGDIAAAGETTLSPQFMNENGEEVFNVARWRNQD
jgi:hypothetical protein